MTSLRIVLAQLNFHVGDIAYNAQKHIEAAISARDQHSADLIIFPEQSITGYPAEDLLFRHEFLNDSDDALKKLLNEIHGIYCLIGHPLRTEKGLYNACSLIFNGEIIAQYSKQHLPNYGVFDEERYFQHGKIPCIVHIKDIPIGILICEDVWFPGPTQQAVMKGAKLILAPNASPFEIDKHEMRLATLAKQAKTNNTAIVYVNQVCGQDELVFDGGSMVINAKGELSHLAGFFYEVLSPVDIEVDHVYKISSLILPTREEKIYQALMLGIRDYVTKNNCPGVIVGASGGIDSALTLAIAVDALGPRRVQAILMPSRFTSEISIEDAIELAKNLNIDYEIISIEPVYQTFLESFNNNFSGKKLDLTEENIQSRCRAVTLMAISNKHGKLVLSTGNRSELAVGYCTLYGDMVGAYAPLKDVYKTTVYQLAKYRNHINPVIPERSIIRAPSAELTHNQTDQDTLPPYEILDEILKRYLNQTQSIAEIVASGFDETIVRKIVDLIRKNEYKRKQSAIGPHIDHKSFGKDWRYPLTNGFKG